MASRGRKRLREKASPAPGAAQEPLAALPDFEAEEKSGSRKCVYNVTFPHPQQARSAGGVLLLAPEKLTKEEMQTHFLAACADPLYTDQRSGSVTLELASVFAEFHKADAEGAAHKHYHVGVKSAQPFRFLPVKRALLHDFGLASHWSCTHEGYWSVIRYCFVPSPQKPRAALDPSPLVWAREGKHPPLLECCHEPLQAEALRKRRQLLDDRAAETGEKPAKMSEMDVWPVVVGKGFRNTPEDRTAHLRLIAFAKRSCSAPMQQFLFRIRARLPALIDDVWSWELGIPKAYEFKDSLLHVLNFQIWGLTCFF